MAVCVTVVSLKWNMISKKLSCFMKTIHIIVIFLVTCVPLFSQTHEKVNRPQYQGLFVDIHSKDFKGQWYPCLSPEGRNT